MKNLLISTLLLMALPVVDAQSIADRFNANAFAYKARPAASATISSTTVYVNAIVVNNNSGGSITFRLRDRSTDCAAAACDIVPDDITLADKTMYVISLPLVEATSGITWSCTSGTGVTLRIVGTR